MVEYGVQKCGPKVSILSVRTLWIAPNVNLSDGNERLKIRIIYFHQKVVNRTSYLIYITIKLFSWNHFLQRGHSIHSSPCHTSLIQVFVYFCKEGKDKSRPKMRGTLIRKNMNLLNCIWYRRECVCYRLIYT